MRRDIERSQQRQRLDPLNTPPRLPDIPEPRPEDLKPFLGHWSLYGPTY